MSKSEKTKIRSPMLTRRRLMIGGGLIGGALVVGLKRGPLARAALSIGAKALDPSAFGPFIKIDADGWVTVIDPHTEMGQGTHCAGIVAASAVEKICDGASCDRVAKAAAGHVFHVRGDIVGLAGNPII